MNYRLMLSCLLICISSLSVAEEQQLLAYDSARMGPWNGVPVKKTFVIASGAYTILCEGANGNNCQRRVTDKLCPAGYTATATTSVVGAGASFLCPIRYIYLEPQPAVPVSGEDSYFLAFNKAYSAGSSSACGKYPLTINYTIYCS